MDITTIGIDIAKRNFQIHGVNKNGKTVLKKKLMREQVLTFMANLPKCLVGIEACGGTNYWAREISKLRLYLKISLKKIRMNARSDTAFKIGQKRPVVSKVPPCW